MTDQEFDTFFHYTTNDKNNICQIQSLTPIAKTQETLILPSHFKGFQVYLPDNCNDLFKVCKAEIIDLSRIIDTSNIRDMSAMFEHCSSLEILDLRNFNTSNVIDMSNIFNDCKSLINLDLSSFNTLNVINMSAMFQNCKSLNNLDLSSFNTSNVINMAWMFFNCASLATTNNQELDKLLPINNKQDFTS